MSPCFVLGRENVPCIAEVVNRSLKADCTDFNSFISDQSFKSNLTGRIYKLKPLSNLSVDHRMLSMLYIALNVVVYMLVKLGQG